LLPEIVEYAFGAVRYIQKTTNDQTFNSYMQLKQNYGTAGRGPRGSHYGSMMPFRPVRKKWYIYSWIAAWWSSCAWSTTEEYASLFRLPPAEYTHNKIYSWNYTPVERNDWHT